jgi:hypothetical protein
MNEVASKDLQETAQKLTRIGLGCERVGPTCFTILRGNKVITLSILEGDWYFETMGALGYKAPKDTNVVDFCNECLSSSEFKMCRIPQNLVDKYSLKQLSDDEFAAAQIGVEIDEED